jgi:hypothetical protein
MTVLREGGAKVSTGKGKGTFKRQSQSGIIVNEILWPIVTPKGMIAWSGFAPMLEVKEYEQHEAFARDNGFELFAKAAKVGMSKHVRVRPRFESWEASGSVTVFDEQITKDVISEILRNAGAYCGIGDWRPSSPSKPGSFGRFNADIQEVE